MAIESIVGPVIGAVVAVSAIWVKEFLERRKNAQVWFDETYIRHGIDRLLEYLRLYDVQLVLLLHGRDVLLLNDEMSSPTDARGISKPLPIEAMIRVETLLKTTTYTQITSLLPGNVSFFISVPSEKRSKVLLTEKITFIRAAYESLVNVRQELLNVSIKRKSQVHSLNQNEILRGLIADFENFSEKYIKNT
ncbi:MAG: hypothetical protein DMF76_11120, partial [Acidobacteria bacterium]